jgi:NitT/TauT family transport system substrate-binding protein
MARSRIIRFVVVATFLAINSLSGCSPISSSPKPLTKITVQLAWTHNAQFAGMYAAEQKGYYSAEGLAVTLLELPAGADPIDVVLSGKAQFGVAAADSMLIEQAQGKALRAIAVIFRRSPRVYVSLAGSGIARPQDMVGKTISVNSPGHAQFEALMSITGIQPDQYTLVNSSSDLSTFYSGQVQVRSVYLTNEVLAMRAAGYALNIIYPDDYGIHNYGDTLVASDTLIASQPDLVERFVRATLKGWTYAVENSTEMGTLVQKYNSSANPSLESEKMAASIPLVNTGEDHIGWMKPAIWAGMLKILEDQGVITTPLDVNQAYTMQFLQAIYGK